MGEGGVCILWGGGLHLGGRGSVSWGKGVCIQEERGLHPGGAGVCIQRGGGLHPGGLGKPPSPSDTRGYSQRASGTHPTGMHSC